MIERFIVSPFAEIWECSITHNKSLHTTVKFEDGQVIASFGPKEIVDSPNYLTIQIGDNKHILLDPEFLQYINHGCDPNLFFDTENLVLIALRNIEIGEELRFFYPSTEWSIDQGFDCTCQSDNCLQNIQGAAHLPLNILKKYKLSNYIFSKIESLSY